jgi:hypothetical protein
MPRFRMACGRLPSGIALVVAVAKTEWQRGAGAR